MDCSNLNNTFIIAEAGVNHNGSIDMAFRLIDKAKEVDADAIKFQIFKTQQLVTKKSQAAKYQKLNLSDDSLKQYQMLKKLELSYNDFEKIKQYCDTVQIRFLASAFDLTSADFIDTLVDIHKIASGEISNTPLIAHLSRKEKPIILSTGMCTLGDIERAISKIQTNTDHENFYLPSLTLLHCTTNYPCPYNQVNLRAMVNLSQTFNLPVGYSDHTLGIEVPIAAVTLGAIIIEKHFTLDKTLPGPDHKASLEPVEFKNMVKSIRNIQIALGRDIKEPTESEKDIMLTTRKSLVTKMSIKKDTVITKGMIQIKRPGTGIQPFELEKVIGLKLCVDKKADQIITWEDFKNF